MKKAISFALVIVMLFSAFALISCNGKAPATDTDAETDTEQKDITDVPSDGVSSDAAAYYKDGNLFIPINLAIKYNTYTVKSDKYTWYVRYSIGIAINHSFDMKEISVECKNNIVTIPEKYANENYFLKTRCNNVATFILVTQKPNSGYIPEPEPDYPIIIR